MYTENIADFGARERQVLIDILSAWNRHGLPDDFSSENVRPAFNMTSGYVFLVNDDYQVAMLNGETLESFYTTPYHGVEGFFDDLAAAYPDMHSEDQEYLRHLAVMLDKDIPYIRARIDDLEQTRERLRAEFDAMPGNAGVDFDYWVCNQIGWTREQQDELDTLRAQRED